MSIYRCSRLYRQLQTNINTCLTLGNNSSKPLRWYTSSTSVLRQKDYFRFGQNQRSTTNTSKKNVIIKPRFRPGDWICPQCHFHNHAHRSKCGECATKVDSSLRQAQGGDWICPHCEYYNFRQRLSCKQCEELRPSPSELLQNRQQQQHRRQD